MPASSMACVYASKASSRRDASLRLPNFDCPTPIIAALPNLAQALCSSVQEGYLLVGRESTLRLWIRCRGRSFLPWRSWRHDALTLGTRVTWLRPSTVPWCRIPSLLLGRTVVRGLVALILCGRCTSLGLAFSLQSVRVLSSIVRRIPECSEVFRTIQ